MIYRGAAAGAEGGSRRGCAARWIRCGSLITVSSVYAPVAYLGGAEDGAPSPKRGVPARECEGEVLSPPLQEGPLRAVPGAHLPPS
eukprot:1445587-Pyramimonas_sp.AAC.1